MIDASVVVVSYNVCELLRRCLASIPGSAPGRSVEIVVVDNGSTDGSVAAVRREFPHVVLITNEANVGFTAANNQALAMTRGNAVLLLNPDAELGAGALETMLAFLETNPNVGVVGPRLRYPDGRTQSSRRRFPTPITGLIESTIVQQWWPNCPVLSSYYVLDRDDDEIQDVDWLYGACLLVRREVVDTVGGFDERFFMYSEELDWCRRIRDHGWRVVYVPSAEVVHHEGRSSEQNLARRAQNFNESKCRYFEKHHGSSVGRALRICLLANTLVDFSEEALKLALLHRPKLRLGRLRNLFRVASFQVRHLSGNPGPSAYKGSARSPCV